MKNVICLTVTVLLFVEVTVQGATSYTVTDLGIRGEESYANRINEYGQVVGTCSSGAFLWTPVMANASVGSMTIVASPGQSISSINNMGQVTVNSPGASQWTPNIPNGTSGSTVSLWNGWAYGVNNSGSSVGFEGDYGGCLWKPTSPNGTVGQLYSLNGVTWSANAINDYGQVAGMTSSTTSVLWQPDAPGGTSGTAYDIGDLPGNRIMSYPVGMNNLGQIVGCSSSSVSDEAEAFLWTPDTPNGITGHMVPLGIPLGCSASQAQAVNNSGEVVGFGWYNEKAFLWTSQDGMVDLNTRIQLQGAGIWHLVDAWGINDKGQIVGNGDYDPDGIGPLVSERHAFLLTPIPEPATLLLLGLGGLVLRRKKH